MKGQILRRIVGQSYFHEIMAEEGLDPRYGALESIELI